ncbi:hypothetical protein [Actinophytocola sp.]|uniref:hypothetical protein n=1 Tax=Actinophytocola sp. TaxID=1872138 RepID=UPI002ED01D4E
MITHGEPLDWSRLRHAYGAADDIPALLEQLRGEDWEEAFGELFNSLLHQGSVYPATVAALPFLVDIAHDRAAPGRASALWLLGIYAESTRLPDGADVEAFDRQARAALDETVRNLLPLLEDADPSVRQGVYHCTTHATGTAEVLAVLRARFEREDNPEAAVALMESLVWHGMFDAADLATVVARDDDTVIFAAVSSAVAAGRDLPGAVDHLVRLWPDHARHDAGDGEQTSLDLLVGAAGARAVPVVRRLQSARAARIDELIGGWVTLAVVSRSGAAPALDGLMALMPDTPEIAAGLVGALARVLPGAPERTPEVCDAIARIAEGTAETAVLANAAVVLFAARDRRWAALATAVVTASPEEPLVGAEQTRFSTALIGFPAHRRATAWAARELVDLAGRAIAAWPRASTGWIEVLAELPADEAVVRAALTAVPHAPACVLLARIGVDHPEVLTPELRPLVVAALRTEGDAAWLVTARAVLDPTDRRDEAFERAWELAGGDEDAPASLLAIWARRPSPAFHATCLRLLDGVAHTSSPARLRQVVAARAVVDTGDAARAWPTVRAIVDEAGDPLPEGIAVGNRIVALEPSRRQEWVDLLGDIARNGREDWSGQRDHWASAVALESLQDLGEIIPAEATDRVTASLLAALPIGTAIAVAPVATRVLRASLTTRPDLRDHVARALARILDADTRIPTSGDSIADDMLVLAALRRALDGNPVGHWSDGDLHPHDPEYSDLVLRGDGTGWTYWCSWSTEFSVVRFRWWETAPGVLEVRQVLLLSGTWSLVDGETRHEVTDREPLRTGSTHTYRITGDPLTLELDRPVDVDLGGSRFVLLTREAVDPAPEHD